MRFAFSLLTILICGCVLAQTPAPILPTPVTGAVKIADFPFTDEPICYFRTATHEFLQIAGVGHYHRRFDSTDPWQVLSPQFEQVFQFGQTVFWAIRSQETDANGQQITVNRLYKTHGDYTDSILVSATQLSGTAWYSTYHWLDSMTVYEKRRNGNIPDFLRLSTDGGMSFQAIPWLPAEWPQKIEGKFYAIKNGQQPWELDSVFISDAPDFVVMQRMELPTPPPPTPPIVLLINSPQVLTASGDTLIYSFEGHSWHVLLPNQLWESVALPFTNVTSLARAQDQNYYLTTSGGHLFRSAAWGGPYTQIDPVELSVASHIIHHVGSTGWVKYKPGYGLMTTTDLGLTWQPTTLDGLPRSGLDAFDYHAPSGQFVGNIAGVTWLNDPSNSQWRPFTHPNGALRQDRIEHTEDGFLVFSSTPDSLFIDRTTDFINFQNCLRSARLATVQVFHDGFAHIDRSAGQMHKYDSEQCAIERTYPLPVSYKSGYFAQIKADTLVFARYPDTLYSSIDAGFTWQETKLPAAIQDALVTVVTDTLYQIDPTLQLWRSMTLGQSWQQVHNNTVPFSSISRHDDLIAATELDGSLVRNYYLTRNPARGWLRWIGAQLPFGNNVVIVQDTVFFNSRTALYRASAPLLAQRLQAQTTTDAFEPQPVFAFAVVPNPASEAFTLHLPDHAVPEAIQITDMQGRIVMDLGPDTSQPVSIQALAAGAYVVTVHLGDGRVGRERLVKL
jgi:Secretion system C-terminal sorting domain